MIQFQGDLPKEGQYTHALIQKANIPIGKLVIVIIDIMISAK